MWIGRCIEYLILDFGFWFPPDKPCANRPGKEREEIPEEEIQALSLVRIFFVPYYIITSKHFKRAGFVLGQIRALLLM